MAKLYEFKRLQEIMRSRTNGVIEETITNGRILTSIDDEEVENRLQPLGGSVFSLLKSDHRLTVAGKLPFVTICLDREYRLAGHLASIRQSPLDLRFTAWSLPYNHRVETHGVPGVSKIHVRSKEVVEALAAVSPLFQQAWKYLQHCSGGSLWLLFLDALPAEQLPSREEDDAAFMRFWEERSVA